MSKNSDSDGPGTFSIWTARDFFLPEDRMMLIRLCQGTCDSQSGHDIALQHGQSPQSLMTLNHHCHPLIGLICLHVISAIPTIQVGNLHALAHLVLPRHATFCHEVDLEILAAGRQSEVSRSPFHIIVSQAYLMIRSATGQATTLGDQEKGMLTFRRGVEQTKAVATCATASSQNIAQKFH